jgi:hypothetical protein
MRLARRIDGPPTLADQAELANRDARPAALRAE